jgi:hypothetical protein
LDLIWTEEAKVVEFTGALRAELQRMQEQSTGSASPIRVSRHQDGSLALEFDEMRDGDYVAVVDEAARLSVVISRDLAGQPDDAILHFRGTGDDRYGEPGLVLLRHRSGTPRTEWTPATAASTARTPMWTGLRRRFGPANPSNSATQSAGL